MQFSTSYLICFKIDHCPFLNLADNALKLNDVDHNHCKLLKANFLPYRGTLSVSSFQQQIEAKPKESAVPEPPREPTPPPANRVPFCEDHPGGFKNFNQCSKGLGNFWSEPL